MTPCTHRWLIATPNGPTSAGVCRDCGEARDDFTNVIPQSKWGGWKKSQPTPKPPTP